MPIVDHWISYPLEAGIVISLILANAFFVAAEFAFVRIRGSQLRAMPQAQRGWRSRIALRVTRHLDAYLSATQVGITLASLGLGWVGEPLIAERLEGPMAHLGIVSHTAVVSISFAIAFATITFLHIVVGELMPKSLAIQHPRPVALWVAIPLVIFYYVLFPFIWLLNGAATLFLKALGIQPVKEFEHGFNQEELYYVLMNSRHVHPSDDLVNKLMLKALRLKDTTAEQVMLPRDQVVVLWRDKGLEDNIAIAQKSGYSRIPYCGNAMDEVLGVVHIKELLWQDRVLHEQTEIAALVRPVLTFTPDTRLPTMLELFRKSRTHLAIVLSTDEKMLGLVSFEDVLEELVGDIRDEFDIEKGPIFERSENTVVVDGDLPLRDLATETGWPITTRTTETVAQWALRHWGHLPQVGAQLDVDSFHLTATELASRRIRRLKIIHRPVPTRDGELEHTPL